MKVNYRYISIIFFCALAFMQSLLNAQDTAIVRTFGGLYFEEGKQIIECSNGGYLIVGTTGSDQSTNSNFYVIRLDDNMNCIWSHSYGTVMTDWGYGAVEDEDGNILVTGYTGDAEGYDVLLIKLTAEGELIWQKVFGGDDWDFAYSICPHPVSGYLIAGKTYSFGNGAGDGYLLHVNDEGDVLHEYTYGGVGEDYFSSVIAINEELIIVGGQYEHDDGQLSAWCQALDGEFVTSWSQHLNEYPNSVVRDLKVADNNNFLICGAYGEDQDLKFGFYRKISPEGSNIWLQSSTEFTVESIAQNNDHVYVVGKTGLFGLGGLAAMILRLDFWSSWQSGAAFGEVYDEIPHDVIVDSENAVVMIGSSNSYSTNQYMDVYAVKFEDPEIVGDYVLEFEHQNCFTVDTDELTEVATPVFTQQNGLLSINWKSDKFHLSVWDVTGRVIYDDPQFKNGAEINLAEWPSSVMIFSIYDGRTKVNFRILSDL